VHPVGVFLNSVCTVRLCMTVYWIICKVLLATSYKGKNCISQKGRRIVLVDGHQKER
jgi:hypothetical protein